MLKKRVLLGVLGSVLFLCTLISSKGFSLLGPFTPWMTRDLNYLPNAGDIGGPMALGEEYRWNIPVITYGFDQSFIEYFGQPGIDAVEQAIQIINDLPPASQIVITNYVINPARYNYQARAQRLYDLKSTTLSLLLEQLGLNSPTRSIWTLRRWDPVVARQWFDPNLFWDGLFEMALENEGFIPDYCVLRNYDPLTTQESHYVNETLYSYYLIILDADFTHGYISYYPIDPTGSRNAAIADADAALNVGEFYTGFSQDDVGGLAFLLNRTNIHVETLDETIVSALDVTNSIVRTALRPGIEKITFLRHNTNVNGNFVAMTNQFLDHYILNGTQATQSVQRITLKPDFIFSVKDQGISVTTNTFDGTPLAGFYNVDRTGTTNWINNSILNTNSSGAGPGVIQGSVQITFPAVGRYVAAAGGVTNNAGYFWHWGSFSGSGENIIHPGNQTNLTYLNLSTKVISSNGVSALEWLVLGHEGASYRIESSTNLVDWTATGSITNTDGIFILHQPLDQPAKYFRTILEE